MDLTTGLARYRVGDPNPLHWHLDERFRHFTRGEEIDPATPSEGRVAQVSVKVLIGEAKLYEDVVRIIQSALFSRMEAILQRPGGSVRSDNSIVELGLDSLAAVEIRQWFYKVVGLNVTVMKLLGATSIAALSREVAGELPGWEKDVRQALP